MPFDTAFLCDLLFLPCMKNMIDARYLSKNFYEELLNSTDTILLSRKLTLRRLSQDHWQYDGNMIL